MKKYSTIAEVWSDLDKGITIHWSNNGYKLFVEPVIPNNTFQAKHFTNREGKVLAARFIENYFGSLLHESDLGSLYSEVA